MVECLAEFFLILASGNMKEFPICYTFEIQNVGQGNGGEKQNLYPFDSKCLNV